MAISLPEALNRGHSEGFQSEGGVFTNCIAGLEDEDLQELRAQGRIARLLERNPETFERVELPRSILPAMDRLTFVFSSDLGDDLICCYTSVLDDFMSHAFLAEYDSDGDTLTLLSPEPLSELLPRHAAHFTTRVPTLDTVLDVYEPSPVTGLDASYSGQHYLCDYPH